MMKGMARILGFANRWKGPTVALVAIVLVGVFAVAALADAPDATNTTNYSNLGFAPNQASVVSISYDASGAGGLGTTTLTVKGGWAWATHGSDCNTDRAGAGYAMDWNDPNDAGYPIGATGISVGSLNPSGFAGNTDGNTVQPTPSGNDPSNPASVTAVASPNDFANWRGGCGEVSTGTITGWNKGGNPPTSFSQGYWGPISHTYVGAPKDLPAEVCAVTYDVHPGTKASANNGLGIPGMAKEITAGGSGGNGDNGVQDNGDTPAGNQCAQIVTATAHVAITKTADAAQVNAGQQIGFTVTVSNDGNADATGVTLADPLPTNAGLAWTIADEGAGWSDSCGIAAGTLNCGPVTVPAGTTQAASTFTVHITSSTTPATGGTCPNTGVVDNTGTVNSTNGGTAQASASTCVNIGTHLPVTCTALSVKPKQLVVDHATKVHLTIMNGSNGVAGVRVGVKGAGVNILTKKSNMHGQITVKVKPKKAGIVTFKTVKTTSACRVSKRLGVPKGAEKTLTG
jgi:uncharacterized repeat protein (TIGR01451 family)